METMQKDDGRKQSCSCLKNQEKNNEEEKGMRTGRKGK